MGIKEGTLVRVINEDRSMTTGHLLKKGDIVRAGEVYIFNKDWQRFGSVETGNQYLLPKHYEIVGVEPTTPRLPSKSVYAVLNKYDQILYTTHERDTAREMKAVYGGKKKGVRIFQYTAEKEIR